MVSRSIWSTFHNSPLFETEEKETKIQHCCLKPCTHSSHFTKKPKVAEDWFGGTFPIEFNKGPFT